MIVIDASASLELILNMPGSGDMRARLVLSREELHAPHLIDLEILQVVRRMVRVRALSAPRAEQVLEVW